MSDIAITVRVDAKYIDQAAKEAKQKFNVTEENYKESVTWLPWVRLRALALQCEALTHDDILATKAIVNTPTVSLIVGEIN